jgi:hypothetical protein
MAYAQAPTPVAVQMDPYIIAVRSMEASEGAEAD